jgi:hypothetical protein
MKKLALGALFAGLCACGGGKDVSLLDGGDVQLCNAQAQTGCQAGEKCTWIVDQVDPTFLGHIGCVPDGAIATGGACLQPGATNGPVPGPNGFDDCAAGNICISGECKVVCDLALVGDEQGCDAVHACSGYSDTFDVSNTLLYGACDPGCDPLTQRLLADGTEACGSTDPANPNKGCYSSNGDFARFSCADVLDISKIDRIEPFKDNRGRFFLNSCAPGFMPFFVESDDVEEVRCTGSCAALEIDSSPEHMNNGLGDAAALAKLPTQAAPAVANGTCLPTAKGSEGTATGGGGTVKQNCVFLWSLVDDRETEQFDEVMGFCFPFSEFTYRLPNTTTDLDFPDCASRPPRSMTTVLLDDDAADFGCQLKINSEDNMPPRPGAKAQRPLISRFVRASNGPGMVRRHKLQ